MQEHHGLNNKLRVLYSGHSMVSVIQKLSLLCIHRSLRSASPDARDLSSTSQAAQLHHLRPAANSARRATARPDSDVYISVPTSSGKSASNRKNATARAGNSQDRSKRLN